jgi:hypothetical protein
MRSQSGLLHPPAVLVVVMVVFIAASSAVRVIVLVGLAGVLLGPAAFRQRPAADDQQRHGGAQQGDSGLAAKMVCSAPVRMPGGWAVGPASVPPTATARSLSKATSTARPR